MTQINDGGPAYPHDGRDNGPGNIKGRPRDGMSLRDYFAGQALAGSLAGYFANSEMSGFGQNDFAELAYGQADAMLAARGATS